MAEIKSTLDLIMERTKNLTLTKEEKNKLKQTEAEGKINGLVQKYLDGIVGAETLQAEVEKERQAFPFFGSMLKTAFIARLQPDGNDEKILHALEQALGIDIAPFQKKLSRFKKELQAEKEDRYVSLSIALKEMGISGTAVVPNPAHDPDWQTTLESMHVRLIEQIKGNPSTEI
jgi:hypothetical protein